jgi:hypothetical protein
MKGIVSIISKAPPFDDVKQLVAACNVAQPQVEGKD